MGLKQTKPNDNNIYQYVLPCYMRIEANACKASDT